MGPGDAASYMINPEEPPENIERLREAMGLNQPWYIRYIKWGKEILIGNWGYSLLDGTSVRSVLGTRIPRTLILMSTSMILAVIIGVGLGIASAMKRDTIFDHIFTFLGLMGISVPHFYVGLMLIFLLSLKLDLFPIGGVPYQPGTVPLIIHMALPVTALTLRTAAVFVRYARGSMLDVLGRDYIALAKSKGLSGWRINIYHVFRTALIPIMTIILLQLPSLVGGSVIIEQVFSWPGIGTMFINSVRATDYPIVMAVAIITTITMLIASLLIDICLAWLDPRVRYE